MFASRVAQPQTKTAASSTNSLAHDHSTLAAHRLGHDTVEEMLFLQRSIGNQGTLRLLSQRASSLPANGPSELHEPAVDQAAHLAAGLSWDFSKIPVFPSDRSSGSKTPSPLSAGLMPAIIQPKLVVGEGNDPLEHEADRGVDQVMRMPAPEVSGAAAPPQVSRKYAARKWEGEKFEKKQGGPQAVSGEAPASVHEAVRSPGRPLNAATRAYFEPRFGHDFSQVRVHTDAKAAESVRSIDAIAYTVNQDVVFGPGQYCPHTPIGRHLLAHELAHTLQQRNASGQARTDLASAEAEAHTAAEAVDKPASTSSTLRVGTCSPGLYRQTAGGSALATPTAATGMTEAEFERTMKTKYATTTIRTGTQADQTDEVATRVRQPASAVTLPQWQSWNPGASSQVYHLILESLEEFQNSIGGIPVIREITFFNIAYEVSLNQLGLAIPKANPDVGASFGGGELTIYRALTIGNKALPIARSNPQGSYPPVVLGVGGVTGQTPGAPFLYPAKKKAFAAK